MPRLPRVDYEGAWHHAMNQGTGPMDIFTSNEDRRAFLHLLSGVPARFDVEVHAYALMGSHFHLLLRSRRARLSSAMQWLGSRYATWFNNRNDRLGTVFRGRFTSRLVEDERYLAWLPLYIHLNPVKDGFVDLPEDWVWSSYRSLVGISRRPAFLSRGAHPGMTANEIRALTMRHLRRPGPYRVRSPRQIATAWSAHPLLDPPLDIHLVDDAVVACFGPASRASLTQPRSAGSARCVAAALGDEWCGLTRSELADHYGFETVNGLASAIRRGRACFDADPDLRRQILTSVAERRTDAA